MQLQTIRAKVSSPDWLNQLSQKYRKDQKERELRKIEDTQKQRVELVKEVVKELGKEDPKVTTAEIEEPSPTREDNKINEKSLLTFIKEIIEILNDHTAAIEALADKVDELSQPQTQKRNGRSAITHNFEPSSRDLEILESKFEQIGLCGEIRKIITPFEVIYD